VWPVAPLPKGDNSALAPECPLNFHPKSQMTEDMNRTDELKKMELCQPCAGIQRNWRKAPGHAELLQGANRQERRGGALVTVTSYRCDRCGTRWEYENDKANLHAGWSVVGR
jgi:hypothetical protein